MPCRAGDVEQMLWNFVWKSAYHDSVTLMRLTRDLEAVPGVGRAAAMMGTPQNRALLKDAGLLGPDGEAASPNDLLIAVAADDEASARAAEAAVRTALTARPAPGDRHTAARPRSLDSALRVLPDATLALISVPGLYAGAEARKALAAGLHVMLFSDNVPIETEVELKRLAIARDLFLMGPDCGTAILNGVPLGFANAVPRGRIGIAAASGTGLQEVACLIAAAGEGISHAIGVGGRDLSDAVGGLMMERALAALARDPATEVVCVIGKPPGPSVARRLETLARTLGKPCVVHFVGGAEALPAAGGVIEERHGFAEVLRASGGVWGAISGPPMSLEDAARAAVALARGEAFTSVEFTAPAPEIDRLVGDATRGQAVSQRFVRGVYSGGTLAWEAHGLLAATLGEVAPGVTGGGAGHRVVDLGEDVFTVGRPHPMIDGTVRREWIEKDGADPSTSVLLLDVVLGYGAHPDPAGELLPAIEAARHRARAAGCRLAVVASVCGTTDDPQPRAAQVARLNAAGVIVMPSNAQAARLAARVAAKAGRG
jgi:FdrA protein